MRFAEVAPYQLIHYMASLVLFVSTMNIKNGHLMAQFQRRKLEDLEQSRPLEKSTILKPKIDYFLMYYFKYVKSIMSLCCRERLEKIIHNKQSAYGDVYYLANYNIYVISGHIFIVDIRVIPKKCITCNLSYSVDIYLDKDDYYATHDGITRLPLKEVSGEMGRLSTIRLYNLPSFGTFLVKYCYGSGSFVMMYNPLIRINELHKSYTSSIESQYMFEVNNEPVFCYKTKQNEFIIADSDDNTLKMVTIHSNVVDGILTFKTPYGDLMGSVGGGIYNYPREWAFVSNSSGLNTKPAIRPADD
jgi:hypothetical protein